MKNSLLKKFFSFSIGGYIALVIGFFTTPIVTRMLSPEQYGVSSVYLLVVNILLLIALLGFDQGFVRYYYEELEINRGKLLKNCLKIPILIVGILIVLLLIFRIEITKFIFMVYDFKLVLLLILMLIFSLLNRYSFLIIRMNQRANIYSILQILNQVLNFIFIIILFRKYGDNYKTIVFAVTATMVILTIVSIILEKKTWLFGNGKSKVSEIELLKYSYPFTITMALTWIFQTSDQMSIKIFGNMQELGLYAAAFKIISLLNIIQTGFTTFWVPVAYEHYTKKQNDLDFFEKVFEYISLGMLILAMLVLLSKDLIILLLGEKFKLSSSIMPCLVFIPLMYTVSETTVLGINFKKKVKYHLTISTTVAIINICGNLFLVPKIGAKGAAISTAVSYIIFFSLRTYYSVKEIKFNFNLKKFYISTVIVFVYALYLTYNELNIKSIFIGIIFLIIILLIHKSIIIESMIKIKEKRMI